MSRNKAIYLPLISLIAICLLSAFRVPKDQPRLIRIDWFNPGESLEAQFSPNYATILTAVESDHYSTFSADRAFDQDLSTDWRSIDTTPDETAWVGQLWLKDTPFPVNVISFSQGSGSNACDSLYIEYTTSGSGSTWITAETVDLDDPTAHFVFDISDSVPDEIYGLRLRANDNPGARWQIMDMQMYTILAAGALQEDTPTPSITPTPSDTPTPTPQYRIEITSTQGAPMYFERRADYGDVATFFAVMIVAVLLVILIMLLYWRRPRSD